MYGRYRFETNNEYVVFVKETYSVLSKWRKVVNCILGTDCMKMQQ